MDNEHIVSIHFLKIKIMKFAHKWIEPEKMLSENTQASKVRTHVSFTCYPNFQSLVLCETKSQEIRKMPLWGAFSSDEG